ncbi:MAG: methyltransferase domain-containing protein [Clostridia bacterium]|nr:methyltransferase domain-containing protein [Clostridia bacterium]
MRPSLQTYYDNICTPWGQLYYRVIEKQLSDLRGKRILDFGAGFGVTADLLAEKNTVVAVEPDAEMTENRYREHDYEMYTGDVRVLSAFPPASFDVILCHNVLEYTCDEERRKILSEFARLLVPGGLLSVVKHNHAGRVMQKVVFENNIEEVLSLLSGGESPAQNFGRIRYYEDADIARLAPEFSPEDTRAVRVFWALQDNRYKTDPGWAERMLAVENAVCRSSPYIDIAFYHHCTFRRREDDGSAASNTVVYNKLVRNGIPDMIIKEGYVPRTRVLSEDEYHRALCDKLFEEAGEYAQDRTPAELADLLELVDAAAELHSADLLHDADGLHSMSFDDIVRIKEEKKQARGGYSGRVYLISKTKKET